MVDRKRLAVSGAVLALVAFATNALIAWTECQRDLDSEQTDGFVWVPNSWQYLRSGIGLTTNFLVALGVVMLLVEPSGTRSRLKYLRQV